MKIKVKKYEFNLGDDAKIVFIQLIDKSIKTIDANNQLITDKEFSSQVFDKLEKKLFPIDKVKAYVDCEPSWLDHSTCRLYIVNIDKMGKDLEFEI